MNFIVDTHTLIWRLIEPERLQHAAKSAFQDDSNEFLVPTVAILEAQYLIEIKRVEVDAGQLLQVLSDQPNFSIVPFDESVMMTALRLTTTRDPFDRVILAHALSSSTKILTKDRWMKKTAPHLVVW